MIEVTDQTFTNDVLNSKLPVLVDFWAGWCGPCKLLEPVLQEISQDVEGYVTVVKLNIEESPEMPAKYGVRSIPTLILFNNGQVVDMQIGLNNKQMLLEWLRSHLDSLNKR